MKQFEAKTAKIGRNEFAIFPFPAFRAANLSGELLKTAAPLIVGIVPLLKSDEDISDFGAEEIRAVSDAFSSFDGDAVERLLKKLLIDGKNITVINEEYPDGERLTFDLANEVFCENVQDMYLLALEVIKLNYNGFFGKLTNQYGGAAGRLSKMARSAITESST